MKIIFTLLLIIFVPQVMAQSLPPCWPRQLGSTGSDFKRGEDDTGQWLGWTCTKNGVKSVYGVFALKGYKIVDPDITGMTPTKAAQAYWKANIIPSTDPKMLALKAKMEAAFK